MRTIRPLRAAGIAAAVLAGGVLAAPAAHAQIPVLPGDSQTVVVSNNIASILVNAPDVNRGQVTGTIFNRTGQQLQCRGLPNPDRAEKDANLQRTPALAATRADTIAKAERYYAQFPFEYDPLLTIKPPVVGDINIGLGSVQSLLPGALAGMIWPDAGQRAAIGEAVTDARISGQFGTIRDIDVPANASINYTVPLNAPSRGDRAQFEAGVLLACTIGGRYHVMAGYQSGERPAEPAGSIGQMFNTGVFGS